MILNIINMTFEIKPAIFSNNFFHNYKNYNYDYCKELVIQKINN